MALVLVFGEGAVRLMRGGHFTNLLKAGLIGLALCGCRPVGIPTTPAPSQQIAVLRGHTSSIECFAFTPDGDTLFSGGGDCVVRVWDVRNAAAAGLLRYHSTSVLSLSVSSDGKKLASADDNGAVVIWDLARLAVANVLPGQGKRVKSIDFSPDSLTLASASMDHLGHGDLFLWNLQTRTREILKQTAPHYAEHVCFVLGGKRLITVNADGTASCWEVSSRRLFKTFQAPEQHYHVLACSQVKPLVALGESSGSVVLLHADTFEQTACYPGPNEPLYGLAFSRSGDMLASATLDLRQHRSHIFLRSGKELKEEISFFANWGSVRVGFDPRERLLAIAGGEDIISLWDCKSLKTIPCEADPR